MLVRVDIVRTQDSATVTRDDTGVEVAADGGALAVLGAELGWTNGEAATRSGAAKVSGFAR
jgi:hypothetical protein